MWTTIGAVVVVAGLVYLAIRYAKAAVRQETDLAAANAAAEEEKLRREQADRQAEAESKKRVDKFNEQAAAVRDADDAIRLLKDAAARTTRGAMPNRP